MISLFIAAHCFLLPVGWQGWQGYLQAGWQSNALKKTTGQRWAGTVSILFPLQWSSNRDLQPPAGTAISTEAPRSNLILETKGMPGEHTSFHTPWGCLTQWWDAHLLPRNTLLPIRALQMSSAQSGPTGDGPLGIIFLHATKDSKDHVLSPSSTL